MRDTKGPADTIPVFFFGENSMYVPLLNPSSPLFSSPPPLSPPLFLPSPHPKRVSLYFIAVFGSNKRTSAKPSPYTRTCTADLRSSSTR